MMQISVDMQTMWVALINVIRGDLSILTLLHGEVSDDSDCPLYSWTKCLRHWVDQWQLLHSVVVRICLSIKS